VKVLIAGAAGRLGRVLSRELPREHELMLGDVRPLDDPRFVPLDVTDVGQVRETVARCEAIIHLSIADAPSLGGTGSLRYAEAALRVHVAGAHNVLRAAADFGGKRVVYASSISAVQGYPAHEMVTSEHRHLGGGVYGITKGFGEELCRMFHRDRGLPVVILRLGHVYFEELQQDKRPSPQPWWVHEKDVARAFALALAAETPRYALVHIVGDNPGGHWDLKAARDLFGWRPLYGFGPDGIPRKLPGSLTSS